jgi:hypothetical protein
MLPGTLAASAGGPGDHDIFKAIRYCGKVYQNELARECRRLGYEVESIRNVRA